MSTKAKLHKPIPADYEVQPLKPGDPAESRCKCLTCGLSWDDGIVTGITPSPSARCPFEPFHCYRPKCAGCGKKRCKCPGNVQVFGYLED